MSSLPLEAAGGPEAIEKAINIIIPESANTDFSSDIHVQYNVRHGSVIKDSRAGGIGYSWLL